MGDEADIDFCFMELFWGTRVGSKAAVAADDFVRGFRLDLERDDFLDASFEDLVDFLDVSLLHGSVADVAAEWRLEYDSCPLIE